MSAGPPQVSLLAFPCNFPIKVMGTRVAAFEQTMVQIALQFDPAFDISKLECRRSSGGKYLSLTLHVSATSQAQLDDLYRALSSHTMVKLVL